MEKHYPAIKETIRLLIFVIILEFLLFFIFAVVALAAGFIKMDRMPEIFEMYPQLLGILNLLSIGLIVFWGYRKTKTPIRQVFPFNPVPLSMFLPITLIMLGLSFLISDLDNLVRWVLNTPVGQSDFLVELINSNNIWISLMVLVIVAPLTEEFLFRGLVLTGFINNYTVKKAILLSAFFFALFHFSIFQIFGAFITGTFFAWLVVKTKSLWPSLYGHALTNLIPVIVVRVLKLNISGFTLQPDNQVVFQPLWLDGAGLLLLLLGFWLLWPKFKERLENPPELTRFTKCEDAETIETFDPPHEIPLRKPFKSGFVALIIGIVTISLLVIALILALCVRGIHNQQLATLMNLVIGLNIILGFLACLTGIGFGIAGMLKEDNPATAITGTILNGLYMLFVVFVIAIFFNNKL